MSGKLLDANGVTPMESIPIEGFDRFEARDPFGNRIEFIQPLEAPLAPPAAPPHAPPVAPPG